eukprot:2949528-Amphidinium_carterae.1
MSLCWEMSWVMERICRRTQLEGRTKDRNAASTGYWRAARRPLSSLATEGLGIEKQQPPEKK